MPGPPKVTVTGKDEFFAAALRAAKLRKYMLPPDDRGQNNSESDINFSRLFHISPALSIVINKLHSESFR